MKRKTSLLLITMLLCVAFTSCEEDGNNPAPEPEVFLKSYISGFIECDSLAIWSCGGLTIDEISKVYYMAGNAEMSTGIAIVINATHPKDTGFYPTNVYQSTTNTWDYRPDSRETDPSVLSYFRNRQECYDKYIEQIGDTAYNRVIGPLGIKGGVVTVFPLEEVIITADKNFCKGYPAGTSLNTFFHICFDDIYASIKNNYKPAENAFRYQPMTFTDDYLINSPMSYRCLKLSDTNLKDYPFTEAKWEFFLHGKPEKTDTYTFHVKLKFANGTVLEGDAPAREIAGER